MPDESTDMVDFISKFTDERWEALNAKFVDRSDLMYYDVHMPIASVSTKGAHLKDTLESLGLRLPFTPGKAQLSMLETPMNEYVSKVIQDATFDLRPNGVTAAAVTRMDIMFTATQFQPPPLMFDRPFVVVIHKKTPGVKGLRDALFTAVVNVPDEYTTESA
eukprot:776921_1